MPTVQILKAFRSLFATHCVAKACSEQQHLFDINMAELAELFTVKHVMDILKESTNILSQEKQEHQEECDKDLHDF